MIPAQRTLSNKILCCTLAGSWHMRQGHAVSICGLHCYSITVAVSLASPARR